MAESLSGSVNRAVDKVIRAKQIKDTARLRLMGAAKARNQLRKKGMCFDLHLRGHCNSAGRCRYKHTWPSDFKVVSRSRSRSDESAGSSSSDSSSSSPPALAGSDATSSSSYSTSVSSSPSPTPPAKVRRRRRRKNGKSRKFSKKRSKKSSGKKSGKKSKKVSKKSSGKKSGKSKKDRKKKEAGSQDKPMYTTRGNLNWQAVGAGPKPGTTAAIRQLGTTVKERLLMAAPSTSGLLGIAGGSHGDAVKAALAMQEVQEAKKSADKLRKDLPSLKVAEAIYKGLWPEIEDIMDAMNARHFRSDSLVKSNEIFAWRGAKNSEKAKQHARFLWVYFQDAIVFMFVTIAGEWSQKVNSLRGGSNFDTTLLNVFSAPGIPDPVVSDPQAQNQAKWSLEKSKYRTLGQSSVLFIFTSYFAALTEVLDGQKKFRKMGSSAASPYKWLGAWREVCRQLEQDKFEARVVYNPQEWGKRVGKIFCGELFCSAPAPMPRKPFSAADSESKKKEKEKEFKAKETKKSEKKKSNEPALLGPFFLYLVDTSFFPYRLFPD